MRLRRRYSGPRTRLARKNRRRTAIGEAVSTAGLCWAERKCSESYEEVPPLTRHGSEVSSTANWQARRVGAADQFAITERSITRSGTDATIPLLRVVP